MSTRLSIAEARAEFTPAGRYLDTAASRRAGATRLSFHLYNTEEDALAAARAVAGK